MQAPRAQADRLFGHVIGGRDAEQHCARVREDALDGSPVLDSDESSWYRTQQKVVVGTTSVLLLPRLLLIGVDVSGHIPCRKTPEGFATLLVLHGVRLENAPQENVRVEQVCDERDSAWAVGARLCEQAHLELVEADELAHADLLCDGDGLERFVNDVDPLGRHELGEDEEPCTRLVVLAHDARLVGDRSMDIGRNEDRSHQAEVKLLRSSGRNREWGQHIAADET
mmetsp:Transcript_18319/g.39528  ORF Transcript_18319/g.39528 Transcript_18319/m.39528 type:complete len:226 (+) Transcript_18319:333-1010(+)